MIKQRKVTLEGRFIILRKPEYKESGVLYKWYNDPEFRNLYAVDLISTKEQIKNTVEYYQKVNFYTAHNLLFMIINRKSGEPLGVAFLDHISSNHKHARFGIGIAEKAFRKKCFGFDAAVVLLDFAFYDLQLHRVWTEVYEHNQQSITACLKFGLRNEGIMRDHIQVNSYFCNLVLFSILEDKYRSLPLVNKWRVRIPQKNCYKKGENL